MEGTNVIVLLTLVLLNMRLMEEEDLTIITVHDPWEVVVLMGLLSALTISDLLLLLTLSFLSGGSSNSYSDAGSCTAYTVYFAAAIIPTLVSNLLLAVEEVERKLMLHLQGCNPVV